MSDALVNDADKAELKKRNRRLGLILATVAVVFFAGFVARAALLGF